MSHGVKYFDWRAGRPRWSPGAGLRAKGAVARLLRDAVGNYLPLWNAMLEAHALNKHYGVKEKMPAPPAQAAPDASKKGYVYFVLAGEFVKIGFSTTSIGRASDMAQAMPAPTAMIVVVAGSRKDEAALHDRFAGDRAKGEWFHVSTRLLNVMVRCVQARRVTLGSTNVR